MMEIRIFNENASNEALEHFRDYLSRNLPDGVSAPEIEKTGPIDDQMGLGILGSIKLVLDSINTPLVELVKCLRSYVETYKTELILPTPNGDIKVRSNRGMSAAEMESLIVNALKEGNQK